MSESEDKGGLDFDDGFATYITIGGTIGQLVSKFTTGQIVDVIGGRPSMYIVLLCTSGCVALLSTAQTPSTLIPLNILNFC